MYRVPAAPDPVKGTSPEGRTSSTRSGDPDEPQVTPTLDLGRREDGGFVARPSVPDVVESPVIYRLLRAVRGSYGFVALALFGLLFLTALAFVFLLPVASVVVLLGSILLLVAVWMGGELLAWLERLLARPSLRRGICPTCRSEVVRTEVTMADDPSLQPPIDPVPEAVLQCTGCPRMFLDSGEEYHLDPDFRIRSARA